MIRLKWTRLSPLILGCVLVSGGLLAAESEQEAGKDPDQALESLLVGEFEGQEGDSRRAARKYIDAARASDDPALAERAASIAFATGDGELAREALARWRELAPERVGVLVLDAGLALRESRIDDAERDLLSLIRQPPDGWKHALRAMLGSANADASALVLARILDARALPEDASAWLAFGGLAQRLGVAEPEQRWLATLTERFPDDPRIALLQAGHLRRSGDREAALSAALRPETRMVWVETPTNPTLKLADLRMIARATRARSPQAILVCDNTFASPINQRPLEHGFDLVMHSSTKYLNGHSDVVGGLLVAKRPEHVQRLRFLQNAIGSVMGPFDAYLTLRGIKTLAVRMARHNESGLEIARWLESRAGVDRVVYPGLASHPQHTLAAR